MRLKETARKLFCIRNLKNPLFLGALIAGAVAVAIIALSFSRGIRFFFSGMRNLLFLFGVFMLAAEIIRQGRHSPAAEFLEDLEAIQAEMADNDQEEALERPAAV
jgi:hypothetical protein